MFNDKRGNLRNIKRFETLAFCHFSSAGRRFAPYQAHQITQRLPHPSHVKVNLKISYSLFRQ